MFRPSLARWSSRTLIAACATAAWCSPAWAQKTDVITLHNGDKITCEIKELERGRLRCKTDAMGTIYIEWVHIRDIDTDKTLEVELESGQRYFGALRPAEEAGEMTVAVGEATTPVASDEVAFVRQVNPTFWGKLDGGIDFGFGFTQSDDQVDYTLNADSRYTGRNDVFSVKLSSSLRVRNDETTQNRQTIGGNWQRALKWPRWFSIVLLEGEHNDELQLDRRGSAGAGVGRYVVQTNRWTWSAYASGVYSREKFTGEEEDNNNFELGLGTNVQVFTFGDHETDVNTTLVVLPSLSDTGRVRLNLTTKVKRELVKDLYFSVDLFETYDSRPPQSIVNNNDFGINMALGWSY